MYVPTIPEPQTLDEIMDWHRGIVDALTDQRASVLQAIRQGSAAPRFAVMTEDEVDAHFDFQRRELDRLTMLSLVASVEATIRVDYFRRVKGRKLKDDLSRAYRRWHRDLSKRKKKRPDFDEGGILDVLKKAKVMDNNMIGQYRECLQVRHWVGHGRYWAKPVEVDRLDPVDVYNRGGALMRALPT
jgi:hypothetical protein